jgi:hypothetical protein
LCDLTTRLHIVKWAAAALPSVIGGPGKDFNGVSGIGPAMAARIAWVGGVGSRTGAGLSLARIALSVLIAQAGQKGDPGLASAGNLANVG